VRYGAFPEAPLGATYILADSTHVVLKIDKGGIFESEGHIELHLTGPDPYLHWKEPDFTYRKVSK